MSQAEAQDALYAEIERQVKAIEGARHSNALNDASTVKDLALAYRLVRGGAQPGSSVVSSN